MTNSTAHQDVPGQFIDRDHLTPKAQQEMTARLNASDIGLLQIENFLQPEIAARISHFLSVNAQYDLLYGYTERKPTTSKAEWLSAPENERFFCYEMLEANTGDALNINAISFIKLRHFLSSPQFKRFVETLSNRKLGAATPVRVHRMKAGHFLKPHSDRGHNREIAFILYLSADWQAEHGGKLHIIARDESKTTISARYNRLLIFDVHQHKHHYLSEITESSTSHLSNGRISINGWFKKSTASSLAGTKKST